jgi:23S rRNA (guanosine2251-2'-O)-methyltransferase
MNELVVVLDNVRSSYNVGSILRSCDGAGIAKVFCCGITPYPRLQNESRPEHVIASNTRQIHKAGLDAEEVVNIEHFADSVECIKQLKSQGNFIIALENKVKHTKNLFSFTTTDKKLALVVGSETDGLDQTILTLCDVILEIPMKGEKNSLNVSVASGIAMYQLQNVDSAKT